MSKTILIAHNYTEDSFAYMSYAYANHLKAKYKVVFLSYRPFFNEPIQDGNLTVYSWYSKKRPTGIIDFLHFSKIYFRHKPNIIIGHFVGANISISLSKIFSFGVAKTMVYYHTLSTQQKIDIQKKNYFKYFRKRVFYKYFVDIVFCNSKMARNDFENVYKLTNGLDAVTPLKDRLSEFNFDNRGLEKLNIGYLGRLDKSKGLDLLLNNIEEFNVCLNIAGTGQLRTVAESLALEGRLNYLGPISYDKVDGFIKSQNAIIIPSYSDNLVTVGIETLMNSKLLILSNKTGLSDYLEDMENVLLIEPNKESIIQALNFVKDNQNDVKRIEINGRKTYESLFKEENYFSSMNALLEI